MASWIVVVLVVLATWMLLGLIVSWPPTRRRLRIHAALHRLAGHARRRPPPPPDPFQALRVQDRLGRLASEIRHLQDTPGVYARRHRLAAAREAYDDLLDEACRLAGVPAPPISQRGEDQRWREEQELAGRGWTW